MAFCHNAIFELQSKAGPIYALMHMIDPTLQPVCMQLTENVKQQHFLQDIFMDAACLLGAIVASPEHSPCVALQQSIVRQLESAGQLLVRKVDVEAKYLNRLEGAQDPAFRDDAHGHAHCPYYIEIT